VGEEKKPPRERAEAREDSGGPSFNTHIMYSIQCSKKERKKRGILPMITFSQLGLRVLGF
jgi:hypothetical protein